MMAIYAPKLPGEPFIRIGRVFKRESTALENLRKYTEAELRIWPENRIVAIRTNGRTMTPESL